jgi:predicted DNA-binding protein
MGIVSVRLNAQEEKMLEYLSEHLHEDRSALIKNCLSELYEDILDREKIAVIKSRETNGDVKFLTAAEVLSGYGNDPE